MLNTDEGKCVIAVGSLDCGYQIYGPFDNVETAIRWAERGQEYSANSWEVMMLIDPKEGE